MKKLASLTTLALAAVLSLAATVQTHAQTFLFDFGSSQQTSGQAEAWNNVTAAIGTNNTGVLLDLVASDFTATTVDLQMVARFSGENTNGDPNSTLFPTTATRDSLYGNTALFSGQSNNFPQFKLTGLDLTKTYDFTFFASRMGVSDNRETLYTVSDGVTGGISGSVALNASNNVDQTVSLFGIAPNALGEILISITPGPNNNNVNGNPPVDTRFTYLNVLTVTAVPEPSTVACLLGGMAVLVARRRRSA